MSCESTWSRLAGGDPPDPAHLAGCGACAAIVAGRVPRGVVPPSPQAVAGRVRARQRRQRMLGAGAFLAVVVLAGVGWRGNLSGVSAPGTSVTPFAAAGNPAAPSAPTRGVLDALDAADAALDARVDFPADDLLALLEPSAEDPLLPADELHALAAPLHPTAQRSP
jgi:hypothetical protein